MSFHSPRLPLDLYAKEICLRLLRMIVSFDSLFSDEYDALTASGTQLRLFVSSLVVILELVSIPFHNTCQMAGCKSDQVNHLKENTFRPGKLSNGGIIERMGNIKKSSNLNGDYL